MKKLTITLIALWLVLVSPTANAWFFFWVPGSVISAVSDSITGDEGESCVAANVKEGDAIRMPDGSIGRIKSLSGKSVRCNNPAQPIRALIVLGISGEQTAKGSISRVISDSVRYQRTTQGNLGSQSSESVKIAIVDGERLLRESAPALAAEKRIERKFRDRDKEIREFAKRGESVELDALKKSFMDDLNVEKNRELRDILGTLNKTVQSFSEKEGIDLVLQKAVYRNPRIDISEALLKRVNNSAW